MNKSTKVKSIREDTVFHAFLTILWVVILFVVLYPLYLVIIASVSEPDALFRGEVVWKPVGLTFLGYETIFQYKEMWRCYLNSVIYTVFGTLLAVSITMTAGYALTRRFPGKKFINLILVFIMLFSGGLIPTFLVMKSLGLYNTPLIMIISGCVSVWNLMITRTYITNTIPEELYEAAELDGASHAQYFFHVLLPMCGTIMAVLTVYYGVSKWNDYYTGLIYLKTRSYFPLQTLLREILATLSVVNPDFTFLMEDAAAYADSIKTANLAKYCIIVVSTGPAVILYILMQKYFVKGIMIGSLKG